MKNYYEILNIPNNADLTTIKKAYRKLAVRYHPDKNPSPKASAMFIEITEAYEVLKNTESRRHYDMLFNEQKTSQTENYEQAWKEYGSQKAKEYSSLNFEDFISHAMDEVKFGLRFSGNVILIAFCAIAVISTPTFFSIDPFFGIFCLLLYGILGFLLFKNTREDYRAERKKRFKD